eukprot:383543-Pelagomonas_calceolata.AAC.2
MQSSGKTKLQRRHHKCTLSHLLEPMLPYTLKGANHVRDNSCSAAAQTRAHDTLASPAGAYVECKHAHVHNWCLNCASAVPGGANIKSRGNAHWPC